MIHLLRSLTDPTPVCGATVAERGTVNPALATCAACTVTKQPQVSEAALMMALRRAAETRGYLYFHVHNSRRSPPGWPACAVLHPSGADTWRCLLECQRTGEQPSAAQVRWLDALARVTAVQSGVVYPHTLSQWVRRWQETP